MLRLNATGGLVMKSKVGWTSYSLDSTQDDMSHLIVPIAMTCELSSSFPGRVCPLHGFS